MRLALLSGTGNRFAVLDAIATKPPEALGALARHVCAPKVAPKKLDGLLVVSRPLERGHVRMDLYNADGSHAETCGNGLRCVAKLARERGHVRDDRFEIEDDAGVHEAKVFVERTLVIRARISMGEPQMLARDEEIELDPYTSVRGDRVDVGNPHFVLHVPDVERAPVATLGPRLERDSAFEHGTNVEFLAFERGGARLRVWERGVGETEACGSGACAAAASAFARGLAEGQLRLSLPGGELCVARRDDGVFELEGDVESFGDLDLDLRARA